MDFTSGSPNASIPRFLCGAVILHYFVSITLQLENKVIAACDFNQSGRMEMDEPRRNERFDERYFSRTYSGFPRFGKLHLRINRATKTYGNLFGASICAHLEMTMEPEYHRRRHLQWKQTIYLFRLVAYT